MGAMNIGQVAQLVEQRTENPRVGSSTLPLGIFIMPLWRAGYDDNLTAKPSNTHSFKTIMLR